MEGTIVSIPSARQVRPSRRDPGVVEAALRIIFPDIIDWNLRTDPQSTEVAVQEQLMEELKEAIEYEDDGYKIAKELDDSHCWDVDEDLVIILSEYSNALYTAHYQAVVEWVAATGPQPKHAVGDAVKVDKVWNRETGGVEENLDGTIYAIYSKTGQYGVRIPKLNHVAEDQIGTQGVIVNWEQIDR